MVRRPLLALFLLAPTVSQGYLLQGTIVYFPKYFHHPPLHNLLISLLYNQSPVNIIFLLFFILSVTACFVSPSIRQYISYFIPTLDFRGNIGCYYVILLPTFYQYLHSHHIYTHFHHFRHYQALNQQYHHFFLPFFPIFSPDVVLVIGLWFVMMTTRGRALRLKCLCTNS